MLLLIISDKLTWYIPENFLHIKNKIRILNNENLKQIILYMKFFANFYYSQILKKAQKNRIKYLIVKNYNTPRMSFLSTEYVVTSINN